MDRDRDCTADNIAKAKPNTLIHRRADPTIPKRHAILLTGFSRDYKATLESFKKNLRHQDNVDLFICFWDRVGTKKIVQHPSITRTGGGALLIKEYSDDAIDLDEIQNDYDPTDIRIRKLDVTKEIIEPMAKIIELSNLNDRGLKFHYHITRTALMFYLIKKTFDLMAFYERENEIEYVNVIRARTDFVQGGYYPLADWDRDYEDAIYVGNWNWSGVGKYRMNDHFAISSRSNMKKYCDFYDQMYVVAQKFANNEMGSKISRTSTKVWSPEHMLSIHLTEAGIKWRNAR